MAGVNKQVPLEDAITEAKWTLGISETTIHDIELGILAQRCLINLGNLNSTYVTNEVIDVIDGEAQLPDHMVKLMAMRYCDQNGVAYGAYIADFSFLDECGCSVSEDGEPVALYDIVMINNGMLQWKYPANAPAKVKIAFRSRKVDKEGFIMIYDYMVDCIKYYLCSEFGLKYIDKYPQWQMWRKYYKAQHDRVVSFDAFQSFQNNFEKMVKASVPKIITL
jgi:hypothetical protein